MWDRSSHGVVARKGLALRWMCILLGVRCTVVCASVIALCAGVAAPVAAQTLEVNPTPEQYDEYFSVGLGYHYQRSTVLTDFWLNDAADFDADTFEIRYAKRDVWRGLSVGVVAGYLDADAADRNIITSGDSSKLELTANYLGPEVSAERHLNERFNVYGRVAFHYYSVRPDYRYTAGAVRVSVQDSVRGFGGAVSGGGEYLVAKSARGDDAALFDCHCGLFVEAGYRYAAFEDLDAALTSEFNRQFGAALTAHDHIIEGWNIVLGLNVHF